MEIELIENLGDDSSDNTNFFSQMDVQKSQYSQ
jgi:hypothetical protein